MIKLVSVTKKYFSYVIFDAVDCEVPAGSVLNVIGSDGSGKTTLLKLMAGIVKPTRGKVYINGCLASDRRKNAVSFMPENNFFHPKMTVGDGVQYYKDFFDDFDMEYFEVFTKRVVFQDDAKITNMSYDDLAFYKLALALSRKTKIYILDEPFRNINEASIEPAVTMIQKRAHKGATIVFSSEYEDDITHMLDSDIVVIDNKSLERREQ